MIFGSKAKFPFQMTKIPSKVDIKIYNWLRADNCIETMAQKRASSFTMLDIIYGWEIVCSW